MQTKNSKVVTRPYESLFLLFKQLPGLLLVHKKIVILDIMVYAND